jgi:hypothetical protein
MMLDRYIDDSAVGCPLVWVGDDQRPSVDWPRVRELLGMAPMGAGGLEGGGVPPPSSVLPPV